MCRLSFVWPLVKTHAGRRTRTHTHVGNTRTHEGMTKTHAALITTWRYLMRMNPSSSG